MTGGSSAFFPPVGYAALWLIAAVVLLVLVASWYVFVFIWTKRVTENSAPKPLPPRRMPSVRAKYAALIDRIAAQYGQGAIDAREAHQRLSLAVRGFAQEVTGIASERMTLAELRATGMPLVGEAVALFYPAEFGARDASGLGDSVAAAHQVVRTWS